MAGDKLMSGARRRFDLDINRNRTPAPFEPSEPKKSLWEIAQEKANSAIMGTGAALPFSEYLLSPAKMAQWKLQGQEGSWEDAPDAVRQDQKKAFQANPKTAASGALLSSFLTRATPQKVDAADLLSSPLRDEQEAKGELSDDTLAIAGLKGPRWFSALARDVERSKQEKMTSEQWQKFLRTRGHGDELFWTQLDSWLQGRAGMRITKGELMDEIGSPLNADLTLPEKVLGHPELPREVREKLNRYEQTVEREAMPGPELDDEMAHWRHTMNTMKTAIQDADPRGTRYREIIQSLREGNMDLWDRLFGTFWPRPDPQYFATLSRQGLFDSLEGYVETSIARKDQGLDGPPDYESLGRPGAKPGTYREVFTQQGDSQFHPASGSYSGSHYPGAIYHQRMSEIPSHTGTPVMFMDESQSDLHQTAAKSGYRKSMDELQDLAQRRERAQADWDNAWNDYTMDHTRMSADSAEQVWGPTLDRLRAEATRAAADYHVALSAPPLAPFKDTWPELTVKRLIREAAERGVSKIGWSDADTQMIRYPAEDPVQYAKRFKGMSEHYDKKIRGIVERLINPFGARAPEKRELVWHPDYEPPNLQDVDPDWFGRGPEPDKQWYSDVPDELLRKALEEGWPRFGGMR